MKAKIFIFAGILLIIASATTYIYHTTQQADINYYKGHSYFQKAKYDPAINFLELAIKYKPNMLPALLDLAYACQWTQKHKEAISYFERILTIQSDDYKAMFSLAQTYSWEKNYAKAISLYKEIIDKTKDIEAKKSLAEVYIWDKQLPQAKELAESIVKDYPNDLQAKLILATALQYSGEPEKAIEYYKQILSEQK